MAPLLGRTHRREEQVVDHLVRACVGVARLANSVHLRLDNVGHLLTDHPRADRRCEVIGGVGGIEVAASAQVASEEVDPEEREHHEAEDQEQQHVNKAGDGAGDGAHERLHPRNARHHAKRAEHPHDVEDTTVTAQLQRAEDRGQHHHGVQSVPRVAEVRVLVEHEAARHDLHHHLQRERDGEEILGHVDRFAESLPPRAVQVAVQHPLVLVLLRQRLVAPRVLAEGVAHDQENHVDDNQDQHRGIEGRQLDDLDADLSDARGGFQTKQGAVHVLLLLPRDGTLFLTLQARKNHLPVHPLFPFFRRMPVCRTIAVLRVVHVSHRQRRRVRGHRGVRVRRDAHPRPGGW
mmetsp:Transcript_42324/g.100554  ORF Transcript_42324/g.100554 Transcript_42324/m.100554 type:complete len:348 (-) Transcript_42324:213-1256(-)